MKKISPKKIFLLIKNNYIINRSVPLILLIGVVILGGIIGAMPISDIETRYTAYIHTNLESYNSYVWSMTGAYEDLIGTQGIFSIIYIVIALILAFLSVLSLNGFMRDKSGNDFYHSLAVNRGEIFIANYVTAYINSAVSIVLSQLAGILLMDMIAGYKPMTLGEMIGAQLPVTLTILLFLAVFTAIAMIASVCAGTVFATLVNYVFINFYIPATILVVSLSGAQLFNTNLMDYLDHYPSAYAYTSPFIRYIYSEMGYYKLNWLSFVLLGISAVALIALGIWLYTVKKNENASKPLPFTKASRPLQYMLLFDAILLGATFFEVITNSFIWCVVGGLLALFFGFIIYNAFVNKSFNGVFKGARHMAFILIATILLGTVFVADVFKMYSLPLPDYDRINYAYINANYQYTDRNEWVSFDFSTEDNDYSIKITDDVAEDVAKLYELLKNDNRVDYTSYAETHSMSVSMGIGCEDDFSRYHTYSYVTPNSPDWEEINEIIKTLKNKYQPSDEDVYYYEETVVK